MGKAILVFRTGQMGDALTALPAMQLIRKKRPDADLILLTDRPSKNQFDSWELLGSLGLFKGVMRYSAKSSLWRRPLLFLRLAAGIRALRPEAIFYFSQNHRSRLGIQRDLFFFNMICGIKNCHGFEAVIYGRKPDGSLPEMEPEWRRLLRISQKGLGSEEADAQAGFAMPVPGEAMKRVDDELKKLGISSATLIAIGFGSKMPAKRWPAERFAELGRRLLEQDPAIRLILLGGPEDRDPAERLVGEWKERSFNFAGRPIMESAAILKRCACYVGNDTGTMHLAASVETPCVAIFSARDYPGVWKPFGSGHVILREETECAGCMLDRCVEKDMLCLKKIGVEAVLSAALDLLRHGSGRERKSGAAKAAG